jgi:hypothetical protein
MITIITIMVALVKWLLNFVKVVVLKKLYKNKMNHNHRIKIKDIYIFIDMEIYMIVKEMLYVNLKHFNKI